MTTRASRSCPALSTSTGVMRSSTSGRGTTISTATSAGRPGKQVLLAIKAKASTLNVADLPDIVDTLKGNFKTSMGLDRIRNLLGVATAFDLANVKQIVLYVPAFTSYGQISGQSVILPHWTQILAVTKANFP